MIYDSFAPPAAVPRILIELPFEGAVKITVVASEAERRRLLDWVGHPQRLAKLVNVALDVVEAESDKNANDPPE